MVLHDEMLPPANPTYVARALTDVYAGRATQARFAGVTIAVERGCVVAYVGSYSRHCWAAVVSTAAALVGGGNFERLRDDPYGIIFVRFPLARSEP